MVYELENYVDFKIRRFKKYNKNIISITYLKNILIIEDELLDLFVKKYEEIVNKNLNSFMIIDARNITSVDFQKVLKKLDVFKKLDKIVKDNIICIGYLINNIIFKNMANTIIKLNPPVVPIKVCNGNSEVLKFLEDVYTKKK